MRLDKKFFWAVVCGVVCTLAFVRCLFPDVYVAPVATVTVTDTICFGPTETGTVPASSPEECRPSGKTRMYLEQRVYQAPRYRDAAGRAVRNRVYSVPGFRRTFPDLQDVHWASAQKWGVQPVASREQAELRKEELVYVGGCPYYTIDAGMNRSIPYLVPQAAELLQRIGRNFLDSLAVKQIPLHTLIVTSVLRTDEDVRKLRRYNTNASEQSCHRCGTTFDISYNRYNTVSSPDGPERRAVRSDTLKWVLSEVLRDMRKAGYCRVKYEVKQGCYHVTVR